MLGAVFLGGCGGGLARHLVVRTWPAPAGGFPWSTLTVNGAGAFVLALLLVLLAGLGTRTAYARPLLGAGFCGALTTFSSIVASVDQLLASGHVLLGGGYLLASAAGGLGFAWLGAVLGAVLGRRIRAGRGRSAAAGGA